MFLQCEIKVKIVQEIVVLRTDWRRLSRQVGRPASVALP